MEMTRAIPPARNWTSAPHRPRHYSMAVKAARLVATSLVGKYYCSPVRRRRLASRFLKRNAAASVRTPATAAIAYVHVGSVADTLGATGSGPRVGLGTG